jgi:hypothetical protein
MRDEVRLIAALAPAASLIALPTAFGGDVSGTVQAEGTPVAGARVTLFFTSLSEFFETRTAADGSFAFTGIPNGAMQLGVAALGHDYEETTIDVSDFPWEQDFALEPESEPGSWDVIGDTLPELFDATDIGILLADGTVFYCHDTVDPIRFDPVTGQKTFPSGSSAAQGCMNGTLMEDGRVIMVGGQDGSDPGNFTDAIPWVKTWTQSGNTWTWLEDMQHDAGRWYPGLARLADGSLLVMGGGQAPDAARTETCERFDLANETWTYTGSMLNPAEFPPSALLDTGQVLATWSPPQLYDPAAGQWQATGDFNQPDRGWPGHSDHSLVVLANGRALAIGVRGADIGNTDMGEIYDPLTGTWSVTSSPTLRRFQSEVVQLPDGRILVAGGETEEDPPPVPHVLGIVKWCDLYDPAADSWRRVADLNWFREYHAVTLLVPDGRVLTTGGTYIKFQFGPQSADIEAYSPPYLFRGVRPEITSMSTEETRRGASLALDIAPDTQLTSVVLLGAQTTTHWVDGGIPRRLVLPVEQDGSSATVVLPVDPNVLPLGRYLLFAMVDDIPSVARIVNVGPRLGDLDGNGTVGTGDLLAMLAAWGPCPDPCPPSCSADLDANCSVGTADLLILLANWG